MTTWPGPSAVVAHVLVVGFHAKLGNRIEFSYPRLRGDPVLRSPKISDTSDISADPNSPSVPPRHLQWGHPDPALPAALPEQPRSPSSARKGDWGVLPDDWAFLPFMALPEGVHDQAQDVVFFTLPPDVHCVACFRQGDAIDAKTHSASSGRSYESSVAARGSVQKSVVLLCRRPLFGVLEDRLVPAVRAYFAQGDFARTDVLASLYHSLNVSLCRPSLNNAGTLFHGLNLRAVIRRLGPQGLAVLKLIMLEKRVIFYSQPVHHASNAVIAYASIFPGALDSIAPTMTPLDSSPSGATHGFPLALFSARDRVILQPYAPLPLVSELLRGHPGRGCLIGTSHNVGLLLSSTAAAAARKAAAAVAAGRPLATGVVPPLESSASAPVSATLGASPMRLPKSGAEMPPSGTSPVRAQTASPSLARLQEPPRARAGLPVVDALVNLSTGKVSVAGNIEPLCRITRQERRLMRDLMIAAAGSSASVSSSGSTGAFVGSDDYIRGRLRAYLTRFLGSVATLDGVLGGPRGGETWSAEMINDIDVSQLAPYNEEFVKAWLQTRNASLWARRCFPQAAKFAPPPAPELDESLIDEPLIPVDRVAAGFMGLRENVAELGRLSNIVSSKAAEGLSSLFKRIEVEVVRMESAVGASNNSSTDTRATASSSGSGVMASGAAGSEADKRDNAQDRSSRGAPQARQSEARGSARSMQVATSAPAVLAPPALPRRE